MFLLFSPTFLSVTSLILTSTERVVIKMFIGLHVKYPLFFKILIKLEFSGKIFEKCSNINFHENPSSERRDIPCKQTDRLDEANSLLRKFVKAP
jgi:hypothetical protein